MEYLGFWIFVSVVWMTDAWLYSQGHNTLIFKHKTPHEKALRRKQTGVDDNEPS